jgi:formamidopyrimidine-DNA glycosylase
MPELPEVEVMCQKLRKWTYHSGAHLQMGALSISGPPKRFLPGEEAIWTAESSLHDVGRRGKYIIFHLNNGLLVSHNAMSGYWDCVQDPWTFDYVEGKRQPKESDVRVVMQVGDKTLRYHDARKFGSLRFYKTQNIEEVPALSKLGPEAIETECMRADALGTWNVLDLATVCSKNNKSIKEILMDQSNVAGIGNIYANEALWLAGISPFWSGAAVSASSTDLYQLFECCKRVLHAAIVRELDYSGLQVYRRETCSRCRGKIEQKKLKGRGTYFCPRCQL